MVSPFWSRSTSDTAQSTSAQEVPILTPQQPALINMTTEIAVYPRQPPPLPISLHSSPPLLPVFSTSLSSLLSPSLPTAQVPAHPLSDIIFSFFLFLSLLKKSKLKPTQKFPDVDQQQIYRTLTEYE
jgi:hypothetical protein